MDGNARKCLMEWMEMLGVIPAPVIPAFVIPTSPGDHLRRLLRCDVTFSAVSFLQSQELLYIVSLRASVDNDSIVVYDIRL